MQGVKSVRFEEVESMIDQMMRVPVFRIADKREMMSESRNSSDPNLIMDLRHKTIGESLPVSLTKSALLAEVTRMLMDEETKALYRKREKELLESELKKFEKGLCTSRPRFRGPYTCVNNKRKINDDLEEYNDLWKMAPRRTKIKVKDMEKIIDSQAIKFENPNENSCMVETIKVTIKDKPTSGCTEDNREILKITFRTLRNYALEENRLRRLSMKIRESVASRRLRRHFEAWKRRMEDSRRLAKRKKEEREMSDERKIELFVSAINEKQRKFGKMPVTRELVPRMKNNQELFQGSIDCEKSIGNNSSTRIARVIESPAQNRLNAQKKIIAEQKMKLAEQMKIIEELRMKKIDENAKLSGRETMSVAKEVLTHCGQRTRRSLIQLMREEGYRDRTFSELPRIPSPPRFLTRMEARAEARRERVRIAEEERKRKLEEQKIREETARREEEENRKRLQLEALREARRIRNEQERKRALEIERSRISNEMADKFYRKYLLRRYIMEPLLKIVELKNNYVKIASNHYDCFLLKKSLVSWRTEVKNQLDVKVELSMTVWRRNMMWWIFKNWHESAKLERKKIQVAIDFYELRLQEKCLRGWSKRAIESRIRLMENERLADLHIEARRKRACFKNWRKFLKIADDVRESDRRRESWRELVQRVVPDFDPKQRGVMIDD